MQEAFVYFYNIILPKIVYWLEFTAVLWAPVLFFELAWGAWVKYVRQAWILKTKKVVLEIKIPQETYKSPAAMELVLNAFIQTGGEGTPVERYWDGKSRPWASLEFCAIDGEVRFFIWAFDNQKNYIMTHLYSQYPDITIHEVEDYTTKVARNLDDYEVWACQYKFIRPDAYPIKTYVDYGLSNDPDEEFKVDPLVPFLETLGATRPEDQIWYQFILRAHKAESNMFNIKQPDRWLDQAKAEIEKIGKGAVEDTPDGKQLFNFSRLSKGQQELIASIERSVSKPSFDVGIRAINVVPKGKSGNINRGLLKGGFRQFGSNTHNNIAPEGTDVDYKWQDWKGKKMVKLRKFLLKCYALRSYFFHPYFGSDAQMPIMVMNIEELATLYHFPGSTLKTPTLRRIPSKRAAPPADLPV